MRRDVWMRLDQMMDADLAEIRDFLAAHEPYGDLPAELLDSIPASLHIAYFRRGAVVIELGARNEYVHILRSGAVDILDSMGGLSDRDSAGDSFGLSSVLTAGRSLYRVVAHEDSLCYLMPAEKFTDLLARSETFARHFMRQQVGRLRDAVAPVRISDSGSALLRTQLKDILRRDPITAPPHLPVGEAARLMAAEHVSALLVTEGSRLAGIFTDRDIRARVVAQDLSPMTPVGEVMTPDPVTIPADRLTMEALAELTHHGVNHVPVMQGRRVIGVVTAGDLMRLARDNPTLLLTELAEQSSVRALQAVVSRIPQVVSSSAGAHAAPGDVARFVTAVADGATRRMLNFAEEELGAPPMRYCWVALGSQGRQETALHSDQDNALILARVPSAEESAYFTALAQYVVDGLAQIGYPRCPGDVMATNPRWRVPVEVWRGYMSSWIRDPEPEAVLHAQIFFDMRPVFGDRSLFERVRQVVMDEAPHSRRFLAHLAQAAELAKPPLRFFRDFVLDGSGRERRTLDIKSGGLAPISQIARLSALALGTATLGTVERLRSASGTRVLSANHGADLIDAYDFLTGLRTRHQVHRHEEGEPLDNRVPPASLSPFERRHLKNAFAVVRRTQSTLPYVYRTEVVGR